jgi:hypothetical protein
LELWFGRSSFLRLRHAEASGEKTDDQHEMKVLLKGKSGADVHGENLAAGAVRIKQGLSGKKSPDDRPRGLRHRHRQFTLSLTVGSSAVRNGPINRAA